jgi:hypothetical protein
MNTIKAIIIKQFNDLPKNVTVCILYIAIPVMAFMMGRIMDDMETYAGIFAALFVGTTPMLVICTNVAEDREYKSLRFLVKAGVKPAEYLFGLVGFVLLMSLLPMAFFVFISGLEGTQLLNFAIVSLLGLIASCILGGAIGIYSKNVQQATAIYTPVMMVVAIFPFLASYNDFILHVASYIYSFQVFLIAVPPPSDAPIVADFPQALIVIAVNIVALLTFFIFAYKKKGLRG